MILADRDMKGNSAGEMSHPYAGLLLAYRNRIKLNRNCLVSANTNEEQWTEGGIKQDSDCCNREINTK